MLAAVYIDHYCQTAEHAPTCASTPRDSSPYRSVQVWWEVVGVEVLLLPLPLLQALNDVLADGVLELHPPVQGVALVVGHKLTEGVEGGRTNGVLTGLLVHHHAAVLDLVLSSVEGRVQGCFVTALLAL